MTPPSPALLARGIVFTILVPVVVGGWLPRQLADSPGRAGWWRLGWVLIAAGAAIYISCLARFLGAGGTPTIFFTRPLRFVLGEEPRELVSRGFYGRSRNPMYLGVVTAVIGQAIVFASAAVGVYALLLFIVFHVVVRFLEEPHLRARQGDAYARYCRRVPRWL
jgi:protein-S-isoprenylcysteine O-methyltransferase Ste14